MLKKHAHTNQNDNRNGKGFVTVSPFVTSTFAGRHGIYCLCETTPHVRTYVVREKNKRLSDTCDRVFSVGGKSAAGHGHLSTGYTPPRVSLRNGTRTAGLLHVRSATGRLHVPKHNAEDTFHRPNQVPHKMHIGGYVCKPVLSR